MQLTRALPVIGVAAMAVAIACSDSGSTAPEGARTKIVSGQTDTSNGSPTNPASPTNPTPPPDTGGGQVTVSNDPLPYVGTVSGMGPAGDTANVSRVAGATVVLSLPADTSAGTPEK
jgi:hypothetical protein